MFLKYIKKSWHVLNVSVEHQNLKLKKFKYVVPNNGKTHFTTYSGDNCCLQLQ
jgi:hypothetical protein